MAELSISDLHPAGSALFSDSESFVGFMRDVSEAELNITGGGSKLKLSKFPLVGLFGLFGLTSQTVINNNNSNSNNNNNAVVP